jgi:hypothetical protein
MIIGTIQSKAFRELRGTWERVASHQQGSWLRSFMQTLGGKKKWVRLFQGGISAAGGRGTGRGTGTGTGTGIYFSPTPNFIFPREELWGLRENVGQVGHGEWLCGGRVRAVDSGLPWTTWVPGVHPVERGYAPSKKKIQAFRLHRFMVGYVGGDLGLFRQGSRFTMSSTKARRTDDFGPKYHRWFEVLKRAGWVRPSDRSFPSEKTLWEGLEQSGENDQVSAVLEAFVCKVGGVSRLSDPSAFVAPVRDMGPRRRTGVRCWGKRVSVSLSPGSQGSALALGEGRTSYSYPTFCPRSDGNRYLPGEKRVLRSRSEGRRLRGDMRRGKGRGIQSSGRWDGIARWDEEVRKLSALDVMETREVRKMYVESLGLTQVQVGQPAQRQPAQRQPAQRQPAQRQPAQRQTSAVSCGVPVMAAGVGEPVVSRRRPYQQERHERRMVCENAERVGSEWLRDQAKELCGGERSSRSVGHCIPREGVVRRTRVARSALGLVGRQALPQRTLWGRCPRESDRRRSGKCGGTVYRAEWSSKEKRSQEMRRFPRASESVIFGVGPVVRPLWEASRVESTGSSVASFDRVVFFTGSFPRWKISQGLRNRYSSGMGFMPRWGSPQGGVGIPVGVLEERRWGRGEWSFF